MTILTVIKATETNSEALNLNSPERSFWLVSFLCCHSLENQFTNSHQPSTSQLDSGQGQAALLKTGQRGERVSGASVGWKHARTVGQQLEEVWTCWQGDIRVANQRTKRTSSGNPAAGRPEDKFHQRRCGALPVHPSSSHHPTLPGFSAALPLSPLQGPTAPGPGFQHWPLRAPNSRRGDWLPARLTLERWAGLSLFASARGGSPPLGVFTTLLWRGHQESSWGRGLRQGPSTWRGFTWTGWANITCSWKTCKTQRSTLNKAHMNYCYPQADCWMNGTPWAGGKAGQMSGKFTHLWVP